jgi:peptidoglycan-associated lipoprotein
MNQRRLTKVLGAVVVGSLVLGSATACATKGFVRQEVGGVSSQVETLGQSLESTQEATRQNAARIGEVDQRANEAGLWAKDAQSAAATANSAAAAAAAKADAVERRMVYEVVISEDQGGFRFGSTVLPDPVKMKIDELIATLKTDKRGSYVEVEGHTDSAGDTLVNQRIGEQRAEAVKRYLYEAHQVPLHKINVISYGEEKPAVPNNTREGRSQNRRVVIRVLA